MSKKESMSSKYLPHELVLEILTWLLVKSLVRFRCVSKLWNSSIASIGFINAHLNKANLLCKNNNKSHFLLLTEPDNTSPNLCMITCNNSSEVSRLEFPNSIQLSRFKFPNSFPPIIVGVYNGIVCLRFTLEPTIYLWNFSIQQFKVLTTTCLSSYLKQTEISEMAVGFSYFSEINDYKIVRIVYLRSRNLEPWIEAEIYTLSTDSWRRLPTESLRSRKIHYVVISRRDTCQLVNGALHWMSLVSVYGIRSNGIRAYIRTCLSSLCFDLNEERFREIFLPDIDFLEVGHKEFLVEYKGSLAVVTMSDAKICLWVMKVYGVVESWTKQIVLPKIFDWFFSCSNTGVFIVEQDHRLILLDPETRRENNLGIQGVTWIVHVTNSMESLVLIGK